MLFKKKAAQRDEAAEKAPAADAPANNVAHEAVDDGIETDMNEDQKQEDLAQVNTTATEDIVYPSGLRLALLLSSAFVSLFLVSLVRQHLPNYFP